MPVSFQTSVVAIGQKNCDEKRPSSVPLLKLRRNCQSQPYRYRAPRWSRVSCTWWQTTCQTVTNTFIHLIFTMQPGHSLLICLLLNIHELVWRVLSPVLICIFSRSLPITACLLTVWQGYFSATDLISIARISSSPTLLVLSTLSQSSQRPSNPHAVSPCTLSGSSSHNFFTLWGNKTAPFYLFAITLSDLSILYYRYTVINLE